MKESTHIFINVSIYLIFAYTVLGLNYAHLVIVIIYSVLPDIDSRFPKIKEKMGISWIFYKKRMLHNIGYCLLLSLPLFIFDYMHFLIAFISYLLHLFEDKLVGK